MFFSFRYGRPVAQGFDSQNSNGADERQLSCGAHDPVPVRYIMYICMSTE